MKTFWDLFAESVIIQGILALLTVGAIIGLLFMGREVPKELWALAGIIIGFYFGAKTQQAVQAYIRSQRLD
jgi:uncharacterized membrane protein YfcA